MFKILILGSRKKLVNMIELASGRDRITKIYDDLKREPFQIRRFFSRGIELGKLELSYNRAVEGEIPQTGPLVLLQITRSALLTD